MKVLRMSFIFLIGSCNVIQAQYLDGVNFGATSFAKLNASSAQKAALATTFLYTAAAGIAIKEGMSKTTFIVNPANVYLINLLEYRTMCNHYINPFKKRRCSNKYNYLKDAYLQTAELIQTPTLNFINKGVKERIGEKYIHIINTIYKELNSMKEKAERQSFLKRMSKN
ncbi:hypothetical protein ACE939_06875 [Aquimarina sp. W85]|uniref:hypothetical protein n=1 Tax=Aquimarina rhodophyticola TaxID=3342246 RepID=UPI003671A193